MAGKLFHPKRIVVALLWACAGLARSQTFATSTQLRDVPFQATQVVTRATPAGTTMTRGRMARDRRGSTYVEMVDPSTGIATTAFLLDVPGHRGIVLDLVHKRYRVRPAPELSSREPLAAAVLDLLESAQRSKGHSERELHQGMSCTITHLGTKLISGLMSIGSTETWPGQTNPPIPSEEFERWFSVELGIFVRMTEMNRASGLRTEVRLTEVLRVEPSPALFEIPPDFQADQEPAANSGQAVDGD